MNNSDSKDDRALYDKFRSLPRLKIGGSKKGWKIVVAMGYSIFKQFRVFSSAYAQIFHGVYRKNAKSMEIILIDIRIYLTNA